MSEKTKTFWSRLLTSISTVVVAFALFVLLAPQTYAADLTEADVDLTATSINPSTSATNNAVQKLTYTATAGSTVTTMTIVNTGATLTDAEIAQLKVCVDGANDGINSDDDGGGAADSNGTYDSATDVCVHTIATPTGITTGTGPYNPTLDTALVVGAGTSATVFIVLDFATSGVVIDGRTIDLTTDATAGTGDTFAGAAVSATSAKTVNVTATKLVVTGTASHAVTATNEITVTARDANANVDTTITGGTRSLTFSGPATSPDGTVPSIETVNIGTAMPTVTFTNGATVAAALTLTATTVEAVDLDVIMTGDEALVSTGAAADDLGLTVTVGAANKVMIATQASTTAIISTAFGTQPVVNITDTYGNTVTGSSATATATVYSDSSCANAAGGYFPNNSATASSGVATFSGLQYSETGAVYLGFASTGITAACGGTSSTVLSPASTSSVTVGGGSGGSDTTAPAAPTGIAVTTSAGKVVITWTDPSDPDLFAIEILRGVGALPVSGTAYDSVGKGVQTYTDTAVSAGDVVKYILRSKDSSSNTSISSEYSITVAAGTTSTVTTTTTTTTTTPVTTTTTTAPVTTTTTTTTQNRYQQAGVSESEVDSAVGSFSDLLKDAWHAPFIARMKNLAILAGYPDGTVQPDRTINRAELAKIATKASNLSTGGERFVDVPGDSWFAPFVGALQSAGAAWTTTANYQPGGDVTRGEALWTLLTAAGVDLDGVTVTKIFPDVSTRHRFAAAITYASQNGIVSGYDNGNFGPGDTLTRGQVAKIVSLIKDL